MKANIEARKDKTKYEYPIIIKFRYNIRTIAIKTGYTLNQVGAYNFK